MAGVRARSWRWAVVWVRLDPVEGHEQAGRRPVLVVSYEPFHRLGLLTIVPITAARATPRLPGDVAVPAGEAGLSRPSVIICSQIRTVAVSRAASDNAFAGGKMHYLISAAIRRHVREALAHHLGLDMRAPNDGAEGTGHFADES